eukprot:4982357-Prorocentrum_lima.AAC.1
MVELLFFLCISVRLCVVTAPILDGGGTPCRRGTVPAGQVRKGGESTAAGWPSPGPLCMDQLPFISARAPVAFLNEEGSSPLSALRAQAAACATRCARNSPSLSHVSYAQ